jgi:hypothetical protein
VIRKMGIIAAGLFLTLTSGCVAWRFEAPAHDIVLARGNVQAALARAESDVEPRCILSARRIGTGPHRTPDERIPDDVRLMPLESFHAFYQSHAQSVILLWAMPLAFLAWRAAVPTRHENAAAPEASAFVAGLTLLFAIETLIDPVATGPLKTALGLGGSLAGSVLMLVFVWLGDFRVFALVLGVMARRGERRRALVRAAGATFIIPIFAGITNSALHAIWPSLPGNTLWLVYELGFLAVAIYLGRVFLARHVDAGPTRDYLRTMVGFSAAYYALWASADIVILGFGSDAGWALRVIPNQLYYGAWVVFAYARFYRGGTLPKAPSHA